MIDNKELMYYVDIPTTITIKMSREEFNNLTMFNFESTLEKRFREQIPLFNDHIHIPVFSLDFSNAFVVDGY